MKTQAVRLHGAGDLRMDTIELPDITDSEILACIISDTMCASTYKAVTLGEQYYRTPDNLKKNPIMIGHEFCGVIEKVGSKWAGVYHKGERFVIQPAMAGMLKSPGFSYPYFGGCSQYAIIPEFAVQKGALLPYQSEEAYLGSLSEPVSCIVNTFHSMFHLGKDYTEHVMGIKTGGNCIILAGAGPMGMASVDYAIHADRRPGKLVITDINQERLDRMASVYTVEDAANNGVQLFYRNTASENSEDEIMGLTGGAGYDDVIIMAPVPAVIEMADRILAEDGCINFFSGPSDNTLAAKVNFYDIHYKKHHFVGTTGGRPSDMQESIRMVEEKRLNPSGLVTHVGGLDTVVDSMLNFPRISGGKKLIYPQIRMPLTAIQEFGCKKGESGLFRELDRICRSHNGLWSGEAERYLLTHADRIET